MYSYAYLCKDLLREYDDVEAKEWQIKSDKRFFIRKKINISNMIG